MNQKAMDIDRLQRILDICVADTDVAMVKRRRQKFNHGLIYIDLLYMRVAVSVRSLRSFKKELTKIIGLWHANTLEDMVDKLTADQLIEHFMLYLEREQAVDLTFKLIAVGKALKFWDVQPPIVQENFDRISTRRIAIQDLRTPYYYDDGGL